MALTGYSFKSVSKWAKRNFADSYEQLPGARAFTFHQHLAPKYIKTGYVHAIVVGNMSHDGSLGTELVAWLEECHMRLGYVVTKEFGTHEIRVKLFEDDRLRFDEPFRYVVLTRDERSWAQLEALVRYCFLMKGTTTAVKDKLADFETHFPGACLSVTSGNARENQKRRLKEDAHKMKGTKANDPNLLTSDGLYGFEIYTQNIVNRVTVFSSPSPSPPPADAASDCTNSIPLVKTENHEHMVTVPQGQQWHIRQEYTDAQAGLVNEGSAVQRQYEKKWRDLHHELEELKLRLAMAERKAEKAEAGAAFWESKCKEMMTALGNGSGEGN